MYNNISKVKTSVILDGIDLDTVVALENYKSDADLAAVHLFNGYSNRLLQFSYVCNIIFISIGIPGNLITICALARYRKIRNAAAIFIINLAISDLATCTLLLPLTVCTLVNRSWILGRTLCRVYPLMKYSLFGVSLLTIVAITINRYVLIVHPNVYHRYYNKRYLKIMIANIWTLPFALMMPTLFEVWGRFSLDTHIGLCAMIPDKNKQTPKITLMMISFFIPCTVICFCYFRIWCVVKKVVKDSRSKPTSTSIVEESSIVTLQVENETETAQIHHNVFLDSDLNSEENSNSTKVKKNVSKRIRKHLQTKLKEISKKQWLPTRKDKRLRTMIIAIMLCFCICHMPVMVINSLFPDFLNYPVNTLISHLLIYSTTFLNPIIYVVMSSEYREAYKRLMKSLFSRNSLY